MPSEQEPVESEPAPVVTQAVTRRRVLLVGNENARRVKESFGTAVDSLSGHGMEVFCETLGKHNSLHDVLAQYHDRVDVLVIAGGDGTLNHLADELVGHRLPIGILPLGTANDLARTLNIPLDLHQACGVVADGEPRPIDLGWVNGKHFFNVASIGLSALITQQLTGEIKKRWGVFAYLITAIRALARSFPFHAQIVHNDSVCNVRTLQIAVGNGRYYGGGLAVAADAAIDDQRLDLYSLEIGHWWEMIPLLFSLRSGQLERHAKTRTMSGHSFEIRTRRRRVVTTDGEITTHTPAVFKIVPRAIQVITPGPDTTAVR